MVPTSAGAFTVVLVSDVLSSDPHAANSINDAAAIAAIFFFIFSPWGQDTALCPENEPRVLHSYSPMTWHICP
jgi:hypothetical protein